MKESGETEGRNDHWAIKPLMIEGQLLTKVIGLTIILNY